MTTKVILRWPARITLRQPLLSESPHRCTHLCNRPSSRVLLTEVSKSTGLISISSEGGSKRIGTKADTPISSFPIHLIQRKHTENASMRSSSKEDGWSVGAETRQSVSGIW